MENAFLFELNSSESAIICIIKRKGIGVSVISKNRDYKINAEILCVGKESENETTKW